MVRREMARREIDLLFVWSPSNITYLTGYDMIWYYLTSPVSVAVHAESGQTLLFGVPYHKQTVEWHVVVDDAEYFRNGQSPAEKIVNSLKGRCWLKGNVGVEDWSRAPLTGRRGYGCDCGQRTCAGYRDGTQPRGKCCPR